MMSTSYNTFPIINDELLKKLKTSIVDTALSYDAEGSVFPLDVDDTGIVNNTNSVVAIQDPRSLWDPEIHNLKITRKVRIKNPDVLFDENGITDIDSELGIAMIWISTKSDQRGIIPFGVLRKGNETSDFVFSHTFGAAQLRGSILLKTVIYLKTPGKSFKHNYIARTPGTVLGDIGSFELLIDGDGSVFPIVTVSQEGEPLWSVFYNDNADPMNDLFDEENVCIMLNEKHPSFDLLRINDSFKESQVFIEVLSAALTIIVQSVKGSLGEEWETLFSDPDIAPGTIAHAIVCFKKDLHWDMSSPNQLSVSIRKFLDANL